MGKPKVVILDEPFANLDPTTQIRLKQIIKKLTDDSDITVLISSHDLTHVTEVCERIVVLDNGAVVKDLQRSEETLKELEAYFAI
jgi:ABC-2 type transport system ATP-binding protein